MIPQESNAISKLGKIVGLECSASTFAPMQDGLSPQEVMTIARNTFLAGDKERALITYLQLWCSGYRHFPIYDSILTTVYALERNSSTEGLLNEMQAMEAIQLPRLYIGAFQYKTRGLDPAIDYYRGLDNLSGARICDKNGIASLRKSDEVIALTPKATNTWLAGHHFHMPDNRPIASDVTIFTVADKNYLYALAEPYLSSVESKIAPAHVHLLLLNCGDADIEHLHNLAKKFENVMITFCCYPATIEANLKSICINTRFMYIFDLLERFGKPVLLTDFDFAFRNAARDLLHKLKDFDFGYISGAWKFCILWTF
jgi:hypothetical protein